MASNFNEPLAGRITSDLTAGNTTIVIHQRRNWLVVVGCILFLAVWTYSGLTPIALWLTGPELPIELALIFWLGIWVPIEFAIIFVLLWYMFGKSVISTSLTELARYDVMLFAFPKLTYDLALVQNLRWDLGSSTAKDGTLIEDGALNFEYKSNTVLLMKKIEKNEGQHIINQMAQSIPEGVFDES